MKHTGREPFERPMRPERIAMIREAVEVIAADSTGRDIAEHCRSFDEYIMCLSWTLYDALGDLCPDTMMSEVQAGMAEALSACQTAYSASQVRG